MWPFSSSPTWKPTKDMPDMSGKVVLVTGGNSGIGFATVEQLALHGAKVYLGARSAAKAEDAIRRIFAKHPNDIKKGSIVFLQLDLSSVSNVRASARKFLTMESRLDVLVNNAGIVHPSFEMSEDNFEMTFAVNHIGHFVFTQDLLDILKKTSEMENSDVRIITVTSGAHSMGVTKGLKFDSESYLRNPYSSPGSYDSLNSKMKRYAVSKLANILFTAELQRRLSEEGADITCMSLHPGVVETEGTLAAFPSILVWFLSLFNLTPAEGAITSLFAASAREIRQSKDKYKGKYLVPYGTLKDPSPLAQDPEVAKDLWVLTKSAVDAIPPK